MKIGKKDLSQWHARQWEASIGNHEIENDSDWVRGSPEPYFLKSNIGFKPIKVTVLIKQTGDREGMIRDRSGILSELLEPQELELDGFQNHFRAFLKGHSFEEKVGIRKDLWHKLTLDLLGYEYGEQQSVSGISSITVVNPGNLITPAVVEIIPTLGAASVTISGICRNQETGEDEPVAIRNLSTAQKVILDGESGLITQGGELKAGDVDIWELPALKPGENKITCNNEKMNITVRFRPRYM